MVQVCPRPSSRMILRFPFRSPPPGEEAAARIWEAMGPPKKAGTGPPRECTGSGHPITRSWLSVKSRSSVPPEAWTSPDPSEFVNPSFGYVSWYRVPRAGRRGTTEDQHVLHLRTKTILPLREGSNQKLDRQLRRALPRRGPPSSTLSRIRT